MLYHEGERLRRVGLASLLGISLEVVGSLQVVEMKEPYFQF
jgi:hypothetical protein